MNRGYAIMDIPSILKTVSYNLNHQIMKRVLITFVLVITIGWCMAQEPFYHILANQKVEWNTGATDIQSIENTGEDCVTVTHQGATVTIKGKKIGLAELTATLSDGTKKLCKVRVTTAPARAEQWKGNYEQKVPKDNFHIEYRDFEEGKTYRVGRINTMYAEVYPLDDGEVYERFDYAINQGYQAYSIDPSFKHYDDSGGDSKEDLENFFRTFGPQNPDVSFADGGWNLVEFGWINTSDEGMRGDVMQTFHGFSWPVSRLADYYVGEETICGVRCWMFDTRNRPPSGSEGSCYWIDPSNGLCLKRITGDGGGFEVFTYDLNYTKWTTDMFPEGVN